MPGKRQTPTVRLRRLAAELRALRASSGLTRDEVVERTGINAVTMYRIEHARVRPQTRTLRTLLDLYGVDKEEQSELVGLLRDARERGWLHAYQSELPEQYMNFIGFEGEARSSWNYESLFVPGLLQTEDYARAVITGVLPFASRDEVERRVEVRMERQKVLRNENPLELWGIVDEAALRRQVGGQSVMRAQLRHLLEASELPHITFQVIPLDAGAHAESRTMRGRPQGVRGAHRGHRRQQVDSPALRLRGPDRPALARIRHHRARPRTVDPDRRLLRPTLVFFGLVAGFRRCGLASANDQAKTRECRP